MQSTCGTQLLLQSTTQNLPVQVNAVWQQMVLLLQSTARNLHSNSIVPWRLHPEGINEETVMLQSTLIAGVMYSKSLRVLLQSTIIGDLNVRRLGVLLQSTLIKLAMHCCSVHTACNLHCGFKL